MIRAHFSEDRLNPVSDRKALRQMIYPSKKDWWLLALVWASVSVPFVMGLYNLLAPGGKPEAGWPLLFAAAVAGATVIWLTYPLQYEITTSELIARSGFMRWKITLSSIEGVSPTRNALSAPAWSLDRLRVDYSEDGKTSFLLISPKDKVGLMHEIAARVGGLEFRGDRLVQIF